MTLSPAPRYVPVFLLLAVAAAGCAASGDAPAGAAESVGARDMPVEAPAEAFCTVYVYGTGTVDLETDYIPHVIACENGGADIEALKAQAIAARSVAYYNMATEGAICDGQGCQVYSCNNAPGDIHYQAAAETSGQYLSYDGMLTYGFYVAGNAYTAPPDCFGGGWGGTEVWVTYNEGLTGGDVWQTELGYVGPPGFGQNRGCMSQWGARCLEGVGYDADAILRFYYGADIEIRTAEGACVGGGVEPGGEGACPFGDGLYCGGNGVAGDPLVLYECAGGALSVVEGCALGCDRRPAGENDACAPAGPCPAGDGLYCGGNGVGGDPDTLYACAKGALSPLEACEGACLAMPSGTDDTCG